MEGLAKVAEKIPILFPMHPRTRKQIELFKMDSFFLYHGTSAINQGDYFCENRLRKVVHACEPLSYLDFLNLVAHATIVLTDSGGIQEETTALNVPCITLRDTTERPITLSEGTNVLVHDDPEKIYAEAIKALEGGCRKGACPEIWDGHTAERIINVLTDRSGMCS
jgi:UDP-N-acetylglucosamine 2-epimerase (non-hydrolysing)